MPGTAASGPRDEDCLYLNVYTQAADNKRRPVFFWIHGGGFTLGSGSEPLYDGSRLATRGDIVVVTIHYRLGALGYLHLGGHGGDKWGATANAGQLDQIAKLTERAANADARQPEAVRAKLAEQLRRIAESGAGLDAERLHQEALLIATKADIQEELDRLRAHIGAARDLLTQDQPVGRKFDFLAQEFNREANTICSKAADIEISRAGMELKTVVDQLREQVQNIE